mmetsp:Transcript_124438/g.346414  ORF Transcript_124438/g.346414 Transcript_124438/m.346414 type:complete len:257 (-) Transcript_124438:178-948(-)
MVQRNAVTTLACLHTGLRRHRRGRAPGPRLPGGLIALARAPGRHCGGQGRAQGAAQVQQRHRGSAPRGVLHTNLPAAAPAAAALGGNRLQRRRCPCRLRPRGQRGRQTQHRARLRHRLTRPSRWRRRHRLQHARRPLWSHCHGLLRQKVRAGSARSAARSRWQGTYRHRARQPRGIEARPHGAAGQLRRPPLAGQGLLLLLLFYNARSDLRRSGCCTEERRRGVGLSELLGSLHEAPLRRAPAHVDALLPHRRLVH